MILEFKTTVNGQRVSIDLDKMVSGQTEFTMSVGDLVIVDSFKDEHGSAIDQAMLLITKLINAGLDRYHSGLKYLHFFLETYNSLDINHDR